jgi:hypothetical protein
MKKITIKKVLWSDAAEKALGSSLGNYATTIRNEVNQNISELFFSPEFGYLVTRLEIRPEDKEFVLVAGSGRNLTEIIPVFCEIAKAAGADKVRYHSNDWRISKLFEAVGFEELERVYIKEI